MACGILILPSPIKGNGSKSLYDFLVALRHYLESKYIQFTYSFNTVTANGPYSTFSHQQNV